MNLIKVGTLFGELGSVTQTKWKPATVFALENSSVIIFNKDMITKIVKVFLLMGYIIRKPVQKEITKRSYLSYPQFTLNSEISVLCANKR